MLKENQPLSQKKEINRKAKPYKNRDKSSFRANVNVQVYCIHPNNQIETREAGSKAREQGRYYSIKPASSVLHDKGEVTERMRSNRGFEEAANSVRIASISDTGEARYYLTDQVDSVKVVVDKEGTTLNKFEYYPYGESWITEGEGNNNPKYNSQELDRETSFYFYNARHYDPEICRFVTADSVVDGNYSANGWNRYMYVGGNPIGYKDPTGHDYTTNEDGFKIDLQTIDNPSDRENENIVRTNEIAKDDARNTRALQGINASINGGTGGGFMGAAALLPLGITTTSSIVGITKAGIENGKRVLENVKNVYNKATSINWSKAGNKVLNYLNKFDNNETSMRRVINNAQKGLNELGGKSFGKNPNGIYSPNSNKHHSNAKGNHSINPIPDTEGQTVLDNAYSSSKTKQLYSIYKGKIVKFQPGDNGKTWHPYLVANTATEVPKDVYEQMLKKGDISKSDYSKLIKNKWRNNK